jgi:hypothetical protein
MVGEEVIDPGTIRQDLDPDLGAFLLRACAPYRSDRFATAQQMRDVLSAIANAAVYV